MQEYANKQELMDAIKKTAKFFVNEFKEIKEVDKDKYIDGVECTPSQMIAYQLGWMNLILSWDKDELDGKEVITPTAQYKWNKLGQLYESFYKQYEAYSLEQLMELFSNRVEQLILWVDTFSAEELFSQDVRKWASSTPSRWPIWKWVHINTVAPFQSFRTKIRKWKKLNALDKSNKIRKFEDKDLEPVMEIWLNTNMQAHDFIPKEYWLSNFNFVKEILPSAEIYVYEIDGDIKGFVGIESGYIAGIFVSNETQSKGIGKELLHTIKGIYSELSLAVYKKNARAVNFYQREQFVVKQERTDESTGEVEYFMVWKK